MAGTNYVVNAGTGTGTYYDFRFPTDGVFWHGSRVRATDITDGLSQTLFVSEALMGAGYDIYTGPADDPRRQSMNVACMAYPDPNRPGMIPGLTDALCREPDMTWRGDRNISWIGGPGQRSVFNTNAMPNDPMHDCGSYGIGWYKASSAHPMGVNVVFGDGSVHFIVNRVDMDTWRAISTRGTSEVPGDY